MTEPIFKTLPISYSESLDTISEKLLMDLEDALAPDPVDEELEAEKAHLIILTLQEMAFNEDNAP